MSPPPDGSFVDSHSQSHSQTPSEDAKTPHHALIPIDELSLHSAMEHRDEKAESVPLLPSSLLAPVPIDPVPRPLIPAVFNALHSFLTPITGGLVPLSLLISRILHNAAQLNSPAAPWPAQLGGTDAHECYLADLTHCLNNVRWDQLTPFARLFVPIAFGAGAVELRKRLGDRVRQDQEVCETVLKPIFVVCGAMRSGTSLMQNALSTHPTLLTTTASLNALRSSLSLIHPTSHAELAHHTRTTYERRIKAGLRLLYGQGFMDRVDASHMVFGNAMEAEEDAQLLFSSAIFPLWDYTTTTHRYVRGHPGADPRRWRWYFVLLKAYYQMWQSGWEDGEVGGWVLKSPCYTRPITTLLSVFHNPTPHTRLASLADPPTTPVSALWLRRHPSRTVPSSARLFETLVGIALPPTGASELADRRKVGLYAARYVGDQWRPLPGEDDPKGEIHAAFLSRVVEVRYGPFVADPVRWLQDAIRARPDVLGTAPGGCGLEWTPEWEERFRAYEEENDERRKKVKEAGMGGQWSAADLGLSEREMIEATGVGWDEVDELME